MRLSVGGKLGKDEQDGWSGVVVVGGLGCRATSEQLLLERVIKAEVIMEFLALQISMTTILQHFLNIPTHFLRSTRPTIH